MKKYYVVGTVTCHTKKTTRTFPIGVIMQEDKDIGLGVLLKWEENIKELLKGSEHEDQIGDVDQAIVTTTFWKRID